MQGFLMRVLVGFCFVIVKLESKHTDTIYIKEAKNVSTCTHLIRDVSQLKCARKCSDYNCSTAGYNLNTRKCYLSDDDVSLATSTLESHWILLVYIFLDCVAPPAPTYGSIYGNVLTHGSDVIYNCDVGYKLVGDNTTTCADGTWNGTTPTCMPDCVAPPAPTYGSIYGNVLTHGSDVIYNCDVGYKLVGDNTTTCADGTWNGTTPTCMPDCGPVVYPNINIDSIDDTTIGSTAVVSCKPGYQFRYSSGTISVVCVGNITGLHWQSMSEGIECWELMFRGTEDSGDSAANAYMYGITGVTTTDTECMLVQNNSCTLHYRNPKLDSWSTIGVRKIRYEMYNNGNVVMSLVMNGAGTTYTDWLYYDATGPWRALEYPWTDMNETSQSWWALHDWDGDGEYGRTFRIIFDYDGCTGDLYYTVVLFEPTEGCNYENHPSWPKFLYTTTNTVSAFDSEVYGMASVMAVWVYHD